MHASSHICTFAIFKYAENHAIPACAECDTFSVYFIIIITFITIFIVIVVSFSMYHTSTIYKDYSAMTCELCDLYVTEHNRIED